MNAIQPTLTPLAMPVAPGAAPPPAAESGSFQDYLLQHIGQVNSMQLEAEQAVEQLFTGGDVNPAEVLTAVQKADIAFRMMMQIRNKIVAAYEEVKQVRV